MGILLILLILILLIPFIECNKTARL